MNQASIPHTYEPVLEMAEYPALQIANALIAICNKHGDLLTNLKLQKLLYYAQAWHLALPDIDRPLFREDLQAWVHGPVEPTVYHQFKAFGYQPILLGATRIEVARSAVKHLENVLDVYGGFSALQLERMTHQELPWQEARGALPPDALSTSPIRRDLMRDFYRAMLVHEQEAQAT